MIVVGSDDYSIESIVSIDSVNNDGRAETTCESKLIRSRFYEDQKQNKKNGNHFLCRHCKTTKKQLKQTNKQNLAIYLSINQTKPNQTNQPTNRQ